MSLYNAATVYILDVPYPVDKPYSYFIPEELRSSVREGVFVSVPFGRGNRQMTAVVFTLEEATDFSVLKPIEKVLESGGLYLNDEMRALCLFMKAQTFCTVGEAVRAMIPTGALRGMCAFYRATGDPGAKKLNEAAKIVYAAIAEASGEREDKGLTGEQIVERFGGEAQALLSSLLSLKLIERRYRSEEKAGRVYEKIYMPGSGEHPLPSGKKQRAIYDAILLAGEMSAGELNKAFGTCSAPLKAMLQKGQISMREEEVYRRAFSKKNDAPDGNILTDEQEEARKTICALCDQGQPKAALLYGVTGSGKTRVMKAVIDEVLARGRSVIVLVPEISLTPQTVGLFSSFFGDEVAIIHSGLSAGQRYDEWRRIREGRARICIGTRSAIFAPFENLGLIIIDEEQEHTYKSDKSPRYHARDIARFRCGRQNAVMLLASATPSVESFYKAKNGDYTLCTLLKRYGDAPLPKAVICDMRGNAGTSPIGEALAEELTETLNKGEQSILFVDRRGYNSFATCTLCGSTLSCPHCSVALHYHAFGRYNPENNSAAERAKNGQMLCHYCGYRRPVPPACPTCGSELLQFIGCGTQMVENELQNLFPDTPILRLDADTTSTKGAFEEKLESFRQGKQRIMLGTQMVTKGHDFPNVTLVGVVSADNGLYLDDFRAGEHAFSLITQVIGRAGRAEKPGRAVIQTYNPDHKTVKYAAKQDYLSFYENEIKLRRALVFPPFCDIVLLTVSGEDEGELRRAVSDLDAEWKKILKNKDERLPLTLFGPFEAPLYRLKDRYRMRYVLKTRNSKALRALLAGMTDAFGAKYKQKVLLSVDVNPSSL